MNLLKTIILCCAVLAPGAADASNLDRHSRQVTLIGYANAPANIVSAKVVDERGAVVGLVKGIQTDAAGKPAAISVYPSDGRPLIVVGAGAATYDRASNVVVTAALQPLGIASAN